MLRYLAAQLFQAVLVVLFVTLVVAVMLRFSGDPAVAQFQGASAPTAEQLQQIRTALGLDQPVWLQYLHFLGGVLRGDFGTSFRGGTSVGSLIRQALPPTVLLALCSLLLSLALSLPLGVYAAVHRGRLGDQLIRFFTLLGLSFPNFWLGIMLVLIFGVTLRWLPPSGYEGAASLVLPSVTLGLILTSTTVRVGGKKSHCWPVSPLWTEWMKMSCFCVEKGAPLWATACRASARSLASECSFARVERLNSWYASTDRSGLTMGCRAIDILSNSSGSGVGGSFMLCGVDA